MPERSSASRRKPERQAKQPDPKDPEFERWLDGRLKSMYDTIINEPLPEEMLKLLTAQKRG